MRLSRLFGKTMRQVPTEAESISHQLLLRAGMILQETTGVYIYLPLGWRVFEKIAMVIKQEMDRIGGQELMLPVLQPFDLWERSGRYVSFGSSLFTVTDRRERKLVLGPTHEEVITELAHRCVQSYRDLPLLLYQVQTKFRDEPRPRGGLIRVREFAMKDMYSFDPDEAGLAKSYEIVSQAYKVIYTRLGLPVQMVEADSGAIGGKDSHEFMVIADNGEDDIISCPACGYSANAEKAQSAKVDESGGLPLPLEEIATPGKKMIQEVASFLDIPASRTLKVVFYSADGEFTLVVIRGDLEVNETKLRNILKCSELRLATESEVKGAGMITGFASPLNVRNVKVVADDSITLGSNFVAGANKEGFHFRNVNYPRDFHVDVMGDVTLTKAGHICPMCGGELIAYRGIEVGHVFKLGTFLSDKFNASFLDRDGVSRPLVMGCYGMGLGRLLAAIVEQKHDDKGIIWPALVAPYQVYLCPLSGSDPKVASLAEEIYGELQAQGIEVLFDDRKESPGIKFNDADLLGIPLRLTLSPRTVKNDSIEAKWRWEKQFQMLPLENLPYSVVQLFQDI
jgi:prolyl-tRNA synthetase